MEKKIYKTGGTALYTGKINLEGGMPKHGIAEGSSVFFAQKQGLRG